MLSSIFNPLKILENKPTPEKIKSYDNKMLKNLQILFKSKIKKGLSGNIESLMKGSGLSFANIRPYNIGDDIRKIDWNVFARTTIPHVREYLDDKQQTFWLIIDVSPSMKFGQNITKLDKTTEIIELFSLIAKQLDSRIGAILIDGDLIQIIKPSSKSNQKHIIYSSIKDFNGKKQNLNKLLSKYCSFGNIVVCISDFIEFNYYDSLSYLKLSKKCNIISCIVYDEIESFLPNNFGILNLSDIESGENVRIDSNDKNTLQKICSFIHHYMTDVQNKLSRSGKIFQISTKDNISKKMFQLIKDKKQ